VLIATLLQHSGATRTTTSSTSSAAGASSRGIRPFGRQASILFDERYGWFQRALQAPRRATASRAAAYRRNERVAERLAAGFNYARIDLYEHQGRLFRRESHNNRRPESASSIRRN